MAKYLVIHPLGTELTAESGAPIATAIKAHLNADAYWLRSVYAREVGKLYCEWDAKDVESIQNALNKAAPDLPTEGIYELDMVLNSEDFR